MDDREREKESRLEQIVREVMQRHVEEEALRAGKFKIMLKCNFIYYLFVILVEKSSRIQTTIAFPRDKRSYQEAMNRPISIISYEPPEYQVKSSSIMLIKKCYSFT